MKTSARHLVCVAGLAFCTLVGSLAAADANVEKFNDWHRVCGVAGDVNTCKLSQRLTDRKGRQIVSFAIQKSKTEYYIEVWAPLGIYIPSGVNLQVDAKAQHPMNLVNCAKTGCRAILPANADLLAELKGGKAVNAIVVDSKSGKTLVLKGTLNGFKSAAEKQGI